MAMDDAIFERGKRLGAEASERCGPFASPFAIVAALWDDQPHEMTGWMQGYCIALLAVEAALALTQPTTNPTPTFAVPVEEEAEQ